MIVSPVGFEGNRRHAQADIVTEQCDEAVEVVGLVRLDQLLDEPLLVG